MGAARISQATAPRNGGVTNEAVTSARMALEKGRSVRATSHAIGAAMAQQAAAELTARMTVVISGSTKSGSVNSAWKWASVKLRPAAGVSATVRL